MKTRTPLAAKINQGARPLLNQRGQSTIMVVIACVCLLVSLLALASSISFVQTMNSTSERRSNAEDFVRTRLQAMKGVVENAGGVIEFARSLEPDPTVYNPLLTADLNNPILFQSLFGFPPVDQISVHNTLYNATFSVSEYQFDAALNVSAIVLNVNYLRDLAYVRFVVDLVPISGAVSGNGQDGPMARHGEIYVAK